MVGMGPGREGGRGGGSLPVALEVAAVVPVHDGSVGREGRRDGGKEGGREGLPAPALVSSLPGTTEAEDEINGAVKDENDDVLAVPAAAPAPPAPPAPP
eukprot:evm.model.NODE_17500_length_1064_cov_18.418234.1